LTTPATVGGDPVPPTVATSRDSKSTVERRRTPQEVAKEARLQSPALLGPWMADLDGFEVETSDLWSCATSVTQRFPDLAGDTPGSAADPWLIALALRHNETTGMFDLPCILVTDEKTPKRSQRVVRIPQVCDQLRIECVDLWGMFELERWAIGVVTAPSS
jgi:Domain of unknown function (DUF4411)